MVGLVVDPDDLLSNCVLMPCQDTHLGCRGMTRDRNDTTYVDANRLKGVTKQLCIVVVPHGADQANVPAESRHVCSSIGRSSGNCDCTLMTKNEDRSLARDPRDGTLEEFVSDRISHYDDPLVLQSATETFHLSAVSGLF